MIEGKPQTIDAVDSNDTLKQIEQRMSKLGDLPIFSASLNKVRRVSSDADSDAMSLAVEVMKDANLTTKLLQLANSPFYNRGLGKITAVSRAVVLLGFETIRSLCLTLKLIESFHTENPGVDMNSMLVNAFLTAGMAREVAEKAGIKDVEQSYICGLLHGLGEIIVAYSLPEKYNEMLHLCEKSDISWGKIQQQQLGGSFHLIGSKLAEQWGFAKSVVQTMQDYRKKSGKALKGQTEINHALSSLSHASLDVIYAKQNRPNHSLGEVFQDMADAVGIHRSDIEECMQQNFRNSCELASDYGLDVKLLMPPVQESKDALLNKTSRQLAFFAGTRSGEEKPEEMVKQVQEEKQQNNVSDIANKKPAKKEKVEKVKVAETQDKKTPEPASPAQTKAVEKEKPASKETEDTGNLQIQLSLLQEITGLISTSAGVHHVFAKVLDGLHEGLGFDRAALCLLSADHAQLQYRLGVGEQMDSLKTYFNLPIRDKRNLFVKVLREGNELYINDVNDLAWKGAVPDEFINQVGASSFAVASLRAGERTVGLFYADKEYPVDAAMQQGFVQFVNQARLALQYAEMQRGK